MSPSLSDLLHLAWQSLGPSMLLQMAIFHFVKNYLVSFDCTGLRCCAQALSSCGEWGAALYSWCAGFSWRWRLFLQSVLSSCGTQAWLLQGMRNLPGSGVTPISPALAGRFLTTRSPEKSQNAPFFNPVATKLPCIFPPLGKWREAKWTFYL